MKSTKLLDDEHYWIEHMLDCLLQVVLNARESGRLDGESSAELLDLFESFADGQHQCKEEQGVFSAIIDKTTESERRYLQKLQTEHVDQREQLQVLRVHLHGALECDPLRMHDFLQQAEEYVKLHRKHMHEESVILFPLIEHTLTAPEDEAVVQEFSLIEACGPEPADVVSRVRALCQRLDVPARSAESPDPRTARE